MLKHPFIFTPGAWEGSGTITFSMAKDELPFTMNWIILPIEKGKIYFTQEIAIRTFPEKTRNHFILCPLSSDTFQIQIQNPLIGTAIGSGFVTSKTITWEFRRKDQAIEGSESYELQKENFYTVRGEFKGTENTFTYIQAFIHKV